MSVLASHYVRCQCHKTLTQSLKRFITHGCSEFTRFLKNKALHLRIVDLLLQGRDLIGQYTDIAAVCSPTPLDILCDLRLQEGRFRANCMITHFELCARTQERSQITALVTGRFALRFGHALGRRHTLRRTRGGPLPHLMRKSCQNGRSYLPPPLTNETFHSMTKPTRRLKNAPWRRTGT